MLPWLFVVLILLNAGLFFWGYQREKSLEPPPMPVPEGLYEIRLIGETPEEFRQASDADALEDASEEYPAAGSFEPPASGTTAPDEVIEQPDAAESTVSEPDLQEPVGDDSPAPVTGGDAGSAESSTEPSAQSQDGLHADELEVEAPEGPSDIVDARSPVPPVAPGPPSEEHVEAMPTPPSDDGR